MTHELFAREMKAVFGSDFERMTENDAIKVIGRRDDAFVTTALVNKRGKEISPRRPMPRPLFLEANKRRLVVA